MDLRDSVTDSLLAGEDQRATGSAVTAREPDPDLPAEQLDWWLRVQERLETRAELADAGLL
jgi:hypothetical protein